MYLCELEKFFCTKLYNKRICDMTKTARITRNLLKYNTQRELYGIRVSRLDLDPADFGIVFSSSG